MDVSEYVQEVISIGYEQQQCNDEGLVDAGDAVRIFSERRADLSFTPDEWAMLHSLAEQAFYKEFKECCDDER